MFDIIKIKRPFIQQSFLNGQIFVCFLIRKLPHDLPGWVTPNPSDTGGSEDDDEDEIQDELEDQTASEVRRQMQILLKEIAHNSSTHYNTSSYGQPTWLHIGLLCRE